MFKCWFFCFDHINILGYYGIKRKEATIVMHVYVSE